MRESFARGDDQAFNETVKAYAADVRRLARRLLGPTDAEDALQEVFVRVYMARQKFRGSSSIRTWVMRITLNTCRSMARRRKFREALLLRWLRRPAASTQANDDLNEHVRYAVRRLPPKEREVVVLYYLEETPVKEIAEILQISQAAVNVRLHRARANLSLMLRNPMEQEQ